MSGFRQGPNKNYCAQLLAYAFPKSHHELVTKAIDCRHDFKTSHQYFTFHAAKTCRLLVSLESWRQDARCCAASQTPLFVVGGVVDKTFGSALGRAEKLWFKGSDYEHLPLPPFACGAWC